MTTLFHDDQDEPDRDREVTLGMGSLLSIFFGVVLVCGIFFGFGYSMGRRNVPSPAVPAAAAKQPATAPAGDDDTTTTTVPSSEAKTEPHDAAPAAKAAATPATEAAKTPAPLDKRAASPAAQAEARPAPPAAAKPSRPSSAAAPADAATLAAVPFAHRPILPGKPHPGSGATGPPPAAPVDEIPAPGHPVMVQIAAVSRQEDAEVLAGALRKRGFSPQVKSGTTDKLFHVQVGPFADKDQAETMKQHLLADGYNAILK